MAKGHSSSWFATQIQNAVTAGLQDAFARVKVDPDDFLRRVRQSSGLPISSFDAMFHLPIEQIDHLAEKTIASSVKFAVLEGSGLGMGGILTLIPDMGILAAIVMRLVQKLSLLYGFRYSTEEETATLWLAAASAAGVDLGRDMLEKEAVEKLVPRIMERVAMRMGAEVAEKWSARLIPIVSGALGGALNYYFVRAWGRRAKQHFRKRHQMARRNRVFPAAPALPGSLPPATA